MSELDLISDSRLEKVYRAFEKSDGKSLKGFEKDNPVLRWGWWGIRRTYRDFRLR